MGVYKGGGGFAYKIFVDIKKLVKDFVYFSGNFIMTIYSIKNYYLISLSINYYENLFKVRTFVLIH